MSLFLLLVLLTFLCRLGSLSLLIPQGLQTNASAVLSSYRPRCDLRNLGTSVRVRSNSDWEEQVFKRERLKIQSLCPMTSASSRSNDILLKLQVAFPCLKPGVSTLSRRTLESKYLSLGAICPSQVLYPTLGGSADFVSRPRNWPYGASYVLPRGLGGIQTGLHK